MSTWSLLWFCTVDTLRARVTVHILDLIDVHLWTHEYAPRGQCHRERPRVPNARFRLRFSVRLRLSLFDIPAFGIPAPTRMLMSSQYWGWSCGDKNWVTTDSHSFQLRWVGSGALISKWKVRWRLVSKQRRPTMAHSVTDSRRHRPSVVRAGLSQLRLLRLQAVSPHKRQMKVIKAACTSGLTFNLLTFNSTQRPHQWISVTSAG